MYLLKCIVVIAQKSRLKFNLVFNLFIVNQSASFGGYGDANIYNVYYLSM